MNTTLHGVCRLTHLGIIEVTGEDCASFLHGQLTQDCQGLGVNQARLAAYCSAKGRVLASFLVLRTAPERFVLVCPFDVLPATLKRLQMFVLRAKVRLRDASADLALHGLAGDAAVAHGAGAGATWQHLACSVQGPATLVQIPAVNSTRRMLWLAPSLADPPTGAALPLGMWHFMEVLGAVAWVAQAVADRFVPQMLNFESVDAVNFKKGCYPGQEVVARSQFRGTLKRRAYLVSSAAPLVAAQELFAPPAAEPVGTIVQAAAGPGGEWHAIACLQTSAASTDAGALRYGGADGPAVRLGTLPYPLLDDI